MKLVLPRYEDTPVLGLPDRAWPITNSERMGAACPRKYLFSYIEGLRAKVDATPLRWGTAWHLVMETIYGYWKERDEPCPMSRVERVLYDIDQEWTMNVGQGLLDAEDTKKDLQRLRRCVQGWIHVYGLDPLENFEVIAVELAVSRPVLNPSSGKPYCPSMWVVEQNGVYRPARTTERWTAQTGDTTVKRVQWPMYQVGRLDFVLRHRHTGTIWGGDHKTSSRPESYLQGLSVDPQMPGYMWMLEGCVRRGLLEGVDPQSRIGGFFYEVAYSGMQHDPDLLKSGKLSTARKRKTPSWRFEMTAKALGLPLAEYDEHLRYLMDSIDPGFYLREWMTVGPEQRHRYSKEIFAEAKRLSGLRRLAAQSKSEETYETHPRVPVCRLPGGSCIYRGPCFEDGVNARANFNLAPSITWNINKSTTGDSNGQ